MVSGQLEDSLRHEIASYIEGRIGGIKNEISALQSQLNEALSQLLDRQSEVQLDGGISASIIDHLRAAHEQGVDLAASESARTQASSDMAIVKAAISEIDEQKSQADILKILVNRGSAFAPRVAFFVVKGEQVIGWRARGFEGTVGDSVINQISFATSADTAIGHAVRSRASWSGGPGSHQEDHIIMNRLGEQPPARIVAVPLVVRDRAVAVFYADSAELDTDAINLEALETLVRVAGMAVELLAARSAPAKQQSAQPQVEDAPAGQYQQYQQEAEVSAYAGEVREYQQPAYEQPAFEPPSYAPVAEYDEISPVVEESAPPAEFTAVEPEPEFQPAISETGFEIPSHYEPEPVAEYTAQPPESFVMPEAPAPAVEAEVMPAPRRRYGSDTELPVEVASEEERRSHSDARRFARLLVSEVKLYNEQKVSDGRSQNDLYQRLREDIDRSRQMYDKRVKPEVAQKYDYFHHELVNTLAEGDPSKLGSEYPGAVSA